MVPGTASVSRQRGSQACLSGNFSPDHINVFKSVLADAAAGEESRFEVPISPVFTYSYIFYNKFYIDIYISIDYIDGRGSGSGNQAALDCSGGN